MYIYMMAGCYNCKHIICNSAALLLLLRSGLIIPSRLPSASLGTENHARITVQLVSFKADMQLKERGFLRIVLRFRDRIRIYVYVQYTRR